MKKSSVSMKLPASLNRIIWMLLGGITVSLMFLGITLFLAVLLPACGPAFEFLRMGRAFQNLQSLWTAERIRLLLIVVGIAGFALGNLAGLRNVQIVKKLYRPVLTFSLPIIIGLYFLNEWIIRISIPHKIKLDDFTNGVLNLNLKAPPGRHYDLRLITPDMWNGPNGEITSSYVFSGHISVSNKMTLLADFPIDSRRALLTRNGFMLNGSGVDNTNLPSLSRFIQPHQAYDIQIKLEPPPPPASTLWLYWQQTSRDANL